MIHILAIILFIIFLIYSIRLNKSEEYTLDSLKVSWVNQANIEGIVTKWIFTLKDSSESVIHTYENSDVNNLRDFTDVNMNIINNKEFDAGIIGDNTLEMYYNETKESNKLHTKTVKFTQDDFGYIINTSNLEEIDIPKPEAMDLTGGFKWYYYSGSYFSDISSFSGKTSTEQGDNVTDFSSKHKATGGHLRNDGNEDNYAVKWEGFFVPKNTGSHKFWTESDDMSYLTIDGVVVVDNGGLHGMVKKSDSINLNAGQKYPIKIYFSEKGGGDELKVWFQGPGMSSATHDFSGYMLK